MSGNPAPRVVKYLSCVACDHMTDPWFCNKKCIWTSGLRLVYDTAGLSEGWCGLTESPRGPEHFWLPAGKPP